MGCAERNAPERLRDEADAEGRRGAEADSSALQTGEFREFAADRLGVSQHPPCEWEQRSPAAVSVLPLARPMEELGTEDPVQAPRSDGSARAAPGAAARRRE